MSHPYSNHFYNKNLQPYANRLRKEMTKAEACLWKYVLRAGQTKDFRFRRQRPVLNHIADFMCKELLLIIEVDGITNHWEEVIQKDEIRQRAPEEAGFTVIRFTDNEILTNMQGVYNYPGDRIEKRSRNNNSYTLNLYDCKSTNQRVYRQPA